MNPKAQRGVVGRDNEFRAVGRFLDSMTNGPTALIVEGPAGIGKSTILSHAVELATTRGWPVLSCQPVEAEGKLSYTGLGDLLEPVLDDVWPHLAERQQ